LAGVTRVTAQPVVAGAASGTALAAHIPLSFWGGFNAETGQIIDQRHPLANRIATDRILVLPSGRGSCSGSGVILEAIQNGTAPAAILISRLDPIIALGSILGDELLARPLPVLLIAESDRQRIVTGDAVDIDVNGLITLAAGR
jgi:predicted aconitase with swiveling domain